MKIEFLLGAASGAGLERYLSRRRCGSSQGRRENRNVKILGQDDSMSCQLSDSGKWVSFLMPSAVTR